jgi:DNA replication protein DnaC
MDHPRKAYDPDRKRREAVAAIRRKVEQGTLKQYAAQHGAAEAEPQPYCDTCNNTGYVYRREPGTHNDRFIDCTANCHIVRERQAMRLKHRRANSRLPEHFWDYTFETWDALGETKHRGKYLAYFMAKALVDAPDHQVSLHEVIRQMQAAFGDQLPDRLVARLDDPDAVRPGLVFYGPVGVGKTGLLAAAFNALLPEIKGLLYLRVQQLLALLRDTWRSQDSELDLLEQFQAAPVLFLDDFNVQGDGGSLPRHQRDYMEHILRERDGANRLTLITTNCDPATFTDMWGERTAEIALKLHWVKLGGAKLRDTRQINLDEEF